MLSDDDGGDIDGILAINQINYNQLVGPVDVYIYINYGFAFFFAAALSLALALALLRLLRLNAFGSYHRCRVVMVGDS